MFLLVIATIGDWGGNPARPDTNAMPWGGDFHNQPVSAGLRSAAEYVRAHTRRGDVMAMGSDAVTGQSQMIVQFISLTDIPAFLARVELKMRGEPCVRAAVQGRMNSLKKIREAIDWSEARGMLRENGIRWFIISTGNPPWDPSGRSAVYADEGFAVYDTGPRERGVIPPSDTCR
jgi:hypothetical protein